MSRREMKEAAKAGLRDAVPGPWLVTLVFYLMTTGISLVVPALFAFVSGWENVIYWVSKGHSLYEVLYYYVGAAGATALVFSNILIGLYTMVVNYGYAGYTLRITRGEPTAFGNLLDGFGSVGRIIAVSFLMFLFIWLWTMLLIIPGIIAAYRYRMVYFILLDDPDCGALEAIRRSKELMKEHKLDLFVLDVSFLNWVLLLIPVGVAVYALDTVSIILGTGVWYLFNGVFSLWFAPYFTCTNAIYYNSISGRLSSGRDSWGWGPEVRF